MPSFVLHWFPPLCFGASLVLLLTRVVLCAGFPTHPLHHQEFDLNETSQRRVQLDTEYPTDILTRIMEFARGRFIICGLGLGIAPPSLACRQCHLAIRVDSCHDYSM